MPENHYPKTILFRTALLKGLTPDAQDWLRRVTAEVKVTLLSENVLRVDYPTDIIKKIRRVNIDDKTFRLDLIAPGNKFWMCNCIFPALPMATSVHFVKHGKQCSCQSEDGAIIFTFPGF